MNISKINSTAFKGYLTIYTKKMGKADNYVTFDTNKIESVKDEQNWKRTEIVGRTGKKGSLVSVTIPYRDVSPEKIMAAYTAACQSDNVHISINHKK